MRFGAQKFSEAASFRLNYSSVRSETPDEAADSRHLHFPELREDRFCLVSPLGHPAVLHQGKEAHFREDHFSGGADHRAYIIFISVTGFRI